MNQGSFLGDCIESTLSNVVPIQRILIDGLSTDNSLDIIHQNRQFLDYYVSETDEGQADAIIKGFDSANGNIHCWLNSDDMLCPSNLHYAINPFNDSGVQWITGNCEFIDGNGNTLSVMNPEIPSTFHEWINLLVRGKSYPIFQPSTFWRKEVWEECGPLDKSLDYSFDHDFFLQIYQKYGPPTYVNNTLSRFRIHDQSKTNNFSKRFEAENRRIGLRNLSGFPIKDQLRLRVISMLK